MEPSRLEEAPVGLLPDSVLISVYRCKKEVISKFREERGIPRYSMLNNPRFPSKEGSFNKIIDKWGVEKAREWLYEHARNLMPFFELDAKKSSYEERNKTIEVSLRGLNTVTSLTFGAKSCDDYPGSKEEERKKIQDEMERFLANGGKKTVCRPAGWAAKEPPTASVFIRCATGMHAKAG